MSRIIAYEEKAQIAADDYLVVDSSTDGTRKIKASLLADADEVGQVKTDLEYISTTGINIFDKSKALLNRAVNLSGVEYSANNYK